MTNPVLFLDNDFLNNIFGRGSTFNEALGLDILSGLKTQYDIQITDVVFDEATQDTTNFPKDAAVEQWLTENNIVDIPTPTGEAIDAGTDTAPNGGERSIVDAANSSAFAGQTVVIASDDGFFDVDNGGASDATVLKTQSLLNDALSTGAVSLDDYLQVAGNNPTLNASDTTQSWLTADEAFNATPFAQNEGLVSDGSGVVTNTNTGVQVALSDIITNESGSVSLSNIAGLFGGDTAAVEQALMRGAVAGSGALLGAAGIAAMMEDILNSAVTAEGQINAGNYTGAAETLTALAARTALGIEGAELGYAVGAGVLAALAEAGVLAISGPAVVAGGLILAVASAVLGASVATAAVEALFTAVGEAVNTLLAAGQAFPDGSALVRAAYATLANSQFYGAMIDPLVVDLTGSGFNLTSLSSSSAYFDFSDSGFAMKTGWIGSGTGLLVTSADPTSGNDLVTSFAQLAAMDSNGDGVINSSDPVFANLYIWQDTNGNGVADSGEVQSLSSLGITSISITDSYVGTPINGNIIQHTATVTFSDSSTSQIGDADFNASLLDTQFTGSFTLNPEVLLLPDLRGYGALAPLYAAMSIDSTLLGLVQTLTNETSADAASFTAQTEAILFRWAGVDGVDPTSRGANIDARILETLEAFNNQSYANAHGNANPYDTQSAALMTSWNTLVTAVEMRLLVQGPLAPLFPGVAFDYDTDSFTGSLSADALAANAPLTPYAAQQYWSLVTNVVGNIEGDLGLTATEGTAVITSAFAELTVPYSFAAIQPAAGSYAFGAGDGQVTVDETGAPAGTLTLIGLDASDVTLQANDSTGAITVTVTATGDSITFTNDGWGARYGDVIDYGNTSQLSSITFADATSIALASTNSSALPTFTWNGTASDTTLTGTNYGKNVFNLGPDGDTVNAGYVGNTFNFASGEGTASVAFATSYGDATNAFNFGLGDGAVSVNLNDAAPSTLNLGAGITESDVTLQADDSTGTVKLMVTGTSDSITFANDLWGARSGDVIDYGDVSLLSAIEFADGSSIALTGNNGSTLPTFTWNGGGTAGTLTGSNYGKNVFNVGADGDTINAGYAGNTFNFASGEGTASVAFATSYGDATNTFNFGEGDGVVSVNLNDAAPSTLNLGAGITQSDVTLQADDSTGALSLTITSTGDSITFASDLWGARSGDVIDYGDVSLLSAIDFADGSSIALTGNNGSTLPTFTWTGGATAGTLTGSNYGKNVFNVGADGDTVNAGYAGNTFNFASGEGTASVAFATSYGDATNTFNFGLGDGAVSVDLNDAAPSTLNLGAGITQSDVTLQADDATGTLSLMITGTSDSITFANDLWGARSGDVVDYGDVSLLSAIDFADGSSIALTGNAGHLPTFTWNASSTDTTFTGSDYGNNLFTFGEGDGAVSVDLKNHAVSTLDLGAGITQSDVTLQADDSTGALSLTVTSTGDSITFANDNWGAQFGNVISYGDTSELESINFADGSSIALIGDAGSLPTLTWNGTSSDTTLTGSDYGKNVFNLGTGGDTVNAGTAGNTINFASGDGSATINLNGGVSNNVLNFGSSIADSQLWLQQSGNDLDINVIGTSDQITLSNWYTAYQLQGVTASGLTLDTQVSQLVSAMATYSSNNGGFNPVTASAMPTDSTLQSAIAAAWHS